MKEFVKTTLAVICGMFIFGVLSIFLLISFFSALIAAGTTAAPLPKDGVLVLDLAEMTIAEQTVEQDPLKAVQGKSIQTIGIWDAVRAINTAAYDNSIRYIYLKPEASEIGMAHLYELRCALENFRRSGKPVISFMNSAGTGSMYLASVSDKVYMTAHPGGSSMFTGVGGQLFFLKDILDRFGVNVQLIRHGKYKSAGEMYVRNSASPENMEQNQAMVSSIWDSVSKGISEGRSTTRFRLDEMIDSLELDSPEDYLNAGLVDGLLTREDLRERLAVLAEKESFQEVNFIAFADYAAHVAALPSAAKRKIAVIYVDGDIVDGSDTRDVAGDRFASVIAKVRADESVKAVVFRVNSPGGSVLASEKIKAEVDLLKDKMPVVASFGNYAASGGYWISANCSHVFSDPVTLTGSIGVFSMIPDFSGTMKNIAHVTYTPINSNRHSDMYSMMRPLDAPETAYLQKSVEKIYSRFVSVVSEGRNLEPSFVDSVAQGRVWTGTEALEIGLVDEIGTLEDAVNYAVREVAADLEDANLNSWTVEGYPKPQTTVEILLEMLNGSNDVVKAFRDTPFSSIAGAVASWSSSLKDKGPYMMARLPYEIIWN